jgi:Zn-finger nucleic acid-binding protein
MFRDDFSGCPACSGKLDPVGVRLRCGQCEGLLVPSAQLAEMLQSTSPDDARGLDERLEARAGTPRNCPRCKVAMEPVLLDKIEVDRCLEHGVWFDKHELAWVLELDGRAFGERNISVARNRHRPDEPNRADVPTPPPNEKPWWKFW